MSCINVCIQGDEKKPNTCYIRHTNSSLLAGVKLHVYCIVKDFNIARLYEGLYEE
jgi:hypothetical protein